MTTKAGNTVESYNTKYGTYTDGWSLYFSTGIQSKLSLKTVKLSNNRIFKSVLMYLKPF